MSLDHHLIGLHRFLANKPKALFELMQRFGTAEQVLKESNDLWLTDAVKRPVAQ